MSDTNIIKDCLEGKQLAYKLLYEKYVSYCYGMCLRYSVSKSEIKDLVQIIFTQTFQSLNKYDSEKAKFKTWFTRVCINNILNHKRAQLKDLPTQQLEDFGESASIHSENNIAENIDREHLMTLLKKMPSNYQIVFNLFIIDGYSHEEISKQLDITTASSRVILNRARKWVKKTLFNVNHLSS